MKDCETARQGAQNLTTHTSVKTPRSAMRALQAVEDQHFDVGRLVANFKDWVYDGLSIVSSTTHKDDRNSCRPEIGN